ncbi:TA system VapC family ribonuclease toxin [uncultured Xylophilus sp.]|uniref:TA system VapC family ribonuclease toxin n=1 Tax=uncultured Xylophilus sp. TaxID=296832 RepID=UPI0025E62D7F|nr:TA system VapC family ribonuclease toxin [uncultured Xylophilus sp.]
MTVSAAPRWLLDVNLLLALTWPHHLHHALARQWFLALPRRPWSSCAVTQLGFVRVSSNPSFAADAVPPPEALRLLARFCAQTDHLPLPDLPPADLAPLHAPGLVGHRQVTDAYLLGLAHRAGHRFATLDRRLLPFSDIATPGVADCIGIAA